MDWSDFQENAFSATDLARYMYCPGKLIMREEVGSIVTEQMTRGTELHEEKASEVLSELDLTPTEVPETLEEMIAFSKDALTKALKDKIILENPEDGILFVAIVPELRIWGVPDRADCSNGNWPIIVDHKFKSSLPYKPWEDNIVQLGVYMLGMEILGFQPEYGYLKYYLRENESRYKDFKIYLDDGLRRQVRDISERARKIIEGQIEPTVSSPRKCLSCEYKDQCKWKLI